MGDAASLKPWIDATINSWSLTTVTNCGYCKSKLDELQAPRFTDSAEECWLDCMREYVNDDFDDETLVARRSPGRG